MASTLENIFLGSKYIGIEIFTFDTEDRFALIQVEKKKNEVIILENIVYSASEELLITKSKLPVALVVNNSQVLQKEIQGTDINDLKIIHKGFPNLNVEDFYYEVWRKGSISVISICRKHYIDELISSFKKNFRITSVSLGISSISATTAFSMPASIKTNTQILRLDSHDSIIETGRPTAVTEYNINGLNISSSYLLAFTSALKFLLPGSTTGNIHKINTTINEEYKQKKIFETVSKAALISLLTLLFVNFVIFSYYFDNVAAMSEANIVNKTGVNTIKKIKQQINEKEQIVNTFTGGAVSKSSFLLNQIVRELPSTILLSEITYHPLEKKVKEQENILVQENNITISGATINNDSFTSWIEYLERIDEIQQVTIASFGKNQENKTEFSIKIEIK